MPDTRIRKVSKRQTEITFKHDPAPEELGKVMADIIVKMMKDYKVPTMAEKGATRQACIDLAEDSIAHNQMQYADVVRPIPIEEYREMLAEMYDLSVQ